MKNGQIKDSKLLLKYSEYIYDDKSKQIVEINQPSDLSKYCELSYDMVKDKLK